MRDDSSGLVNTVGPIETFEYRGRQITLRHLVSDDTQRQSLLMRALAAISWWGVQEDLWEWAVYDGETLLASDQELSKLAAVEGAKYWTREWVPDSDA